MRQAVQLVTESEQVKHGVEQAIHSLLSGIMPDGQVA